MVTEDCAEDFIAITQQIAGCWIPRKSLNHLLSCPLGRRMFGHVEVGDLKAIMSEHEKEILDSECSRRHGEEVD